MRSDIRERMPFNFAICRTFLVGKCDPNHVLVYHIAGHRDGAVLFKCADGSGLWISHMKRVNSKNNEPRSGGVGSGSGEHAAPPIKLPATSALPKVVVEGLPLLPSPSLYVPFGERPSTFQEASGWGLAVDGVGMTRVESFVQFVSFPSRCSHSS